MSLNKTNFFLVFISFIFVLSTLTTYSVAETIDVCSSGCQYNSIQYAINNAKDGDKIYVRDGVYKEHVVLNDKSITLMGENRDSTIIDGSGSGICVHIVNANVIVTEFSLKNCNGVEIRDGSHAVIYKNRLSGLGLYTGTELCWESSYMSFLEDSGIYNRGGSSKIYDNIILNNKHGIVLHSGAVNNEIYDNVIEKNCGGITLIDAKITEIFQNTIRFNANNGIRVDISSNTEIYENDIIENTEAGIVACSTIIAHHNNLSRNSKGIYLRNHVENSQINNNSFISNRYGIYLSQCEKNKIEYNTFRDSITTDISLIESAYNTVKYNSACNIESIESNDIGYNICSDDSPELSEQSKTHSETINREIKDNINVSNDNNNISNNDKKSNLIDEVSDGSSNIPVDRSDSNSNVKESDIEEVNIIDLLIFLSLVAVCIFIYIKNKRKKEELKRKKMEEEIIKKLEEKRRKKEKEDNRRKKEQEDIKRKKEEEEKHKIEENEKRKFEEKQRAKGLVKYKNNIWLKPKALEHLKKIELGLNNNFKDYTPYDFEKFIAKLFEKMGYFCNVTKKTGDYGVDVVARKGKDTIVIQAKKYKHGNNVGNVDVQKILGAMWKYEANKAIVVTTSDFTVQAESQAKEAPVELWDRQTLHAMVKFYFIDKEIGRMTNDELEENKRNI